MTAVGQHAAFSISPNKRTEGTKIHGIDDHDCIFPRLVFLRVRMLTIDQGKS